MKAYIDLLRINVCILGALAAIVGALVSKFFFMNEVIIAALAVFIICGAGNVLNDYFDYKIDKINKPSRPIPSGKVKLKAALAYSAALFLIGNIIAVLYLNIYMALFAIINSIIIILYDWKIKRTPAGHFADSYIGASPFIFGGLLTYMIQFPVIILFLLGFFGNLSREIMKGIEDITGDKKAEINTLEIALGIKPAKIIAILALFISIALMPLPYLMGFVSVYYLPPIIFAGMLIMYSLININNPRTSKKILKTTMFVVLFAFLAGLL